MRGWRCIVGDRYPHAPDDRDMCRHCGAAAPHPGQECPVLLRRALDCETGTRGPVGWEWRASRSDVWGWDYGDTAHVVRTRGGQWVWRLISRPLDETGAGGAPTALAAITAASEAAGFPVEWEVLR